MFADDIVLWIEAENSRKYEDLVKKLKLILNKAQEVLQIGSNEKNMIMNKNKAVYQFFSLRCGNTEL